MRCLNVGCGPIHHKKGWHNIDIRPFPGVDEVRDATLPFEDLTPIKYIYSEHFIEHLSLDSAVSFLRNSLAALEPSGRIRISTPALEWVLATHFDLKDDHEDTLVQATFQINRAFHGWGHQFLWSKAMLRAALAAAGFEDIRFWPYGESDDPALAGLEQHGEFHMYEGWPSVWIVEGTRGRQTTDDDNFFRRCETEFQRYVRDGH